MTKPPEASHCLTSGMPGRKLPARAQLPRLGELGGQEKPVLRKIIRVATLINTVSVPLETPNQGLIEL